jgi:hypothetical protein
MDEVLGSGPDSYGLILVTYPCVEHAVTMRTNQVGRGHRGPLRLLESEAYMP